MTEKIRRGKSGGERAKRAMTEEIRRGNTYLWGEGAESDDRGDKNRK